MGVLAVDLYDDIALFDALLLRIGVIQNLGDIKPHGNVVILGDLLAYRADRDADGRAAVHRTVVHEGGNDALQGVRRNRKADALDVRKAGHYLHICDADDLPAVVEKRAAGVALIYGGVGLQKVHDGTVVADLTAGCGDDPARHRETVVGAEWVADGADLVARLDVLRACEHRRCEAGFFYLQYRNITLRVGGDELSVKSRSVVKLHGRTLAFVNDMRVRENVAVRGDDDAAAPAVRVAVFAVKGLDTDDTGRALLEYLIVAELRCAG